MRFYNDVDSRLKQWINHYWHMEGDLDSEKLYEILPMDHSDIIITVEGEFSFFMNEKKISPPEIFFQGIKSTPMFLRQTKFTETMGISFKPWGLYSVIGMPMNNFQEKVADVEKLNGTLAEDLIDLRRGLTGNMDFPIKALDEILLKSINVTDKDIISIRRLQEYIESGDSIENFATDKGISRRQIERDFSKYIGTSPSKFNQIRKFEFVSRELLYSQNIDLSDLTWEGEYYDQSHLNKQFKKYSRKAPGSFIKDKASLKSKIDFE